MPSSTSNSEARAATRAIGVLLLGMSLYCIGLEFVTRFGFSRISRIQRRVNQDRQAAKILQRSASDGTPTLLVVGNSLLLKGVDRDSLRSKLAPSYSLSLLPIENTQFEDWYFGLRLIFREGSSPAVVVVCLSTRQMMSRSTDGEYFAHFLMKPGDLLAVKRESQLDNTSSSAYFFANSSEWLGSRAQIRNWLLQEIMPSLEGLITYFPGQTPPMPSAEQVVAGVLPHLVLMDKLCRENGARFVVVVPPTPRYDDASAEVQGSAAKAGIQVLVPLRPGEVPAEEFPDGYHLDQRGAMRFTQHLGPDLLHILSTQ